MNWHWPSTPDNEYAPWYVILRRAPMCLLLYILASLLLTVILLGWGCASAREFWEDMFD